MSLPASDAFTGTGALSGSWTTDATNGFDRSSNQARNQNLTNAIAFWNADAFNNDQYSQCIPINDYTGPSMRVADLSNGYVILAELAGTINIQKVTAGTRTGISSRSSWTPGHTLKFQAVGTTLQVFDNGVQQGTDLTDSSFATGAAGIYAFQSGTFVDTWEGGNTGGGSPDVTLALTGVSGTGAVGTFGVTHTQPLTGVSGTGAVGNLSVSGSPDVTRALTGVSATGAVGTFGVTHTQPLTGAAGTGAVGSLAPGMTAPLTGVSATGAAGALGVTRTRALTGVSATGAVGTLTPSGGTAVFDIAIALDGNSFVGLPRSG